MSEQTTLEVQVGVDAGCQPAELAELTSRLRRELLELDVDTVDHASAGEPPVGAKALDVILIGTLLVKLGRSAVRLTSVVHAMQVWLGRNPGRSIKLQLDGDTIEVTGVSSPEQKRLIDVWIERHSVHP